MKFIFKTLVAISMGIIIPEMVQAKMSKVDLDETKFCFAGTADQRESAAKAFLNDPDGIGKIHHNGTDGTLESVFKDIQPAVPAQNGQPAIPAKDLTAYHMRSFYHLIAVKMQSMGCAFEKSASVDTIAETVDALVNARALHLENLPTWLKPGFYAVIYGKDSPNKLVVEVNNDGLFVFHACRNDDGTYGNMPLTSKSGCQTLGPPSLAIPVSEWMNASAGKLELIRAIFKTVVTSASILTSNLGFLTFAQPIAATATQFLTDPQDNITEVRSARNIQRGMKTMLLNGQILDENPDSTGPLTQVLPFLWQDIVSGIVKFQGDIFTRDYEKMEEIYKNPRDLNILITNAAYHVEQETRAVVKQEVAQSSAPPMVPTTSTTSGTTAAPPSP